MLKKPVSNKGTKNHFLIKCEGIKKIVLLTKTDLTLHRKKLKCLVIFQPLS